MENLSEIWIAAKSGGVTMGIIVFFSLVGVFVAIERALALWGLGDSSRRLSDSVIKSLYRGDLPEARAACERSGSPFADILLAAFARVGKAPPAAVQAAVERERAQVGLKLRSRLWILGTIGATAPFVGLFGTVVGIMRAFKDMAAHPGGGFGVVAAGISEALVATAAGIAVAIEAVVLYNYFSSRVAALLLHFKVGAEEVVELLGHDRGSADATAPAPPPAATAG
ncbi:MAG TPA: MotA/TolQ/ExbB proton channel family protein [Vulgatibacter sp.]